MSARVLTGAAAEPAEPIVWRRLPAGAAYPPGAPRAEPEPPPAQPPLQGLTARVAELEQELERREEQGYAAGFRQGESAGRQAAAAQLEPVLQRFAETIERLTASRRQLRRQAEEDVVKLALAIARRIVFRELSVDPEALLGVVKAALEKFVDADRLRLHPDDAAALKPYFERLEIVPDPHLERGAAIFESQRGRLDASVETQLQEIERGLADRLRRLP